MSSLLKKIKDSIKFSIAPQAFVHQQAKDQGVGDKKIVTDFIQSAQKYDPGSKYLGFSGVPGVTSQKDIKNQKQDAEQAQFQAATTAAATEADAQQKANLAQADQLAQRRKNQLFTYGANRSSLGGVGSSPVTGAKTLLGY